MYSQERETDVRAGARLQRVRESGGTGTRNCASGGGGCDAPVRVHARRGADATGGRPGKEHAGGGGDPRGFLQAAPARAAGVLAREQ